MNVDNPLYVVAFIILFAWVVTPAEADESQQVWVFGDSLSSPHNSWANQLDDLGFMTVKNTAQAGLRLIDLTIPTYINCERAEVLLWIGTNDAGNNVSKTQYETALTDHLQFLEGRNCDVSVVLPILVTLDYGLRERTLAAREWTLQIASMYQNVKVLDAPYNPEQTTDGLHPNFGAQFWLAVWFANELNLTTPE